MKRTMLCAGATLASLVALACSSSSDSSARVGPSSEAGPAPIAGDDGGPGTLGTDAAIDAPVAIPGSGGKGGLACTTEQDLGGGRKSCVTKIGSVELKILTPAAGSGPMRLGLYVHGDGAAAHKSGSALKAMVPWADAQHGLGVSVLAPNGCAWWQTPAHDCTSTQTDPDLAGDNVAPLVAVLDAVMKAYDVRTDGVRYYGSSGGSIFLTDAWLPLQGVTYPGVFALMCGGVVASRAYAWDTKDATLRAKDPLWFTYGDQDFLLTDIQATIADAKKKSFVVTEKVIAGAGHCEFDAHGEAIGIWNAHP